MARFSNCLPTINMLFEWLSFRADTCENNLWYDSDDIEDALALEWDKDSVEDAINILKDMIATNEDWKDIPIENEDSSDWSMPKRLKENLIQLAQTDGITPEYVRNFLWDAFIHCEPSIDYIRFEWI